MVRASIFMSSVSWALNCQQLETDNGKTGTLLRLAINPPEPKSNHWWITNSQTQQSCYRATNILVQLERKINSKKNTV